MARTKRTPQAEGENPINLGLEEPKQFELSSSHEDFFTKWKNHPVRSDLLCYVYRHWPIIDRARVGIKEKHIDKIPGENLNLDESWVKRKHGSGRYKLTMVDSGPHKAKLDRFLNIDDPDFPPDEDPKELVLGHPDNKGEEQRLRRLGKLKEGESDMAGSDQNAATAAMAGTIDRMAEKLAAGGGNKTESELTVLHKALEVVKELKTAQSGNVPAGPSDELVELRRELAQQRKETYELLKTQLEKAAVPVVVKDPVEEITRWKEIFQTFDRGGGDNGGGGDGMPVWVEKLIGPAMEVVMKFASRPAVPAIPPGFVLVPAAGPAAAGSVPAAGIAAAAAVPAPAAGGNEGGATVAILDLGKVRAMALQAFERGVTGYAFALGLVEDPFGAFGGQGEQVYGQLLAAGKDRILIYLRESPLWPDLAGRSAEVEAWVASLLEYGELESDGGAEGAPGSNGVTA